MQGTATIRKWEIPQVPTAPGWRMVILVRVGERPSREFFFAPAPGLMTIPGRIYMHVILSESNIIIFSQRAEWRNS